MLRTQLPLAGRTDPDCPWYYQGQRAPLITTVIPLWQKLERDLSSVYQLSHPNVVTSRRAHPANINWNNEISTWRSRSRNSDLKCFGQSSEWWLERGSTVVWLGQTTTRALLLRQQEHAPSINLKLKACVCPRKSQPDAIRLHLTKTHPEMCLDDGFPSQTQARLRCDHAEWITKMKRSERHLLPELKPLGPASVNTKIVCHTLIRMHAPQLLTRIQRLPEIGVVWCVELYALQTRWLRFLQSGFQAITIALCIVLQEQRLCSRWFADGEDQEVHSSVDLPQNPTGFSSVNKIWGLVNLGWIWVQFGPQQQTVGVLGVN